MSEVVFGISEACFVSASHMCGCLWLCWGRLLQPALSSVSAITAEYRLNVRTVSASHMCGCLWLCWGLLQPALSSVSAITAEHRLNVRAVTYVLPTLYSAATSPQQCVSHHG